MNRTNKTSVFRLSGVKAVPEQPVTRSRGGVLQELVMRRYTFHISILLYRSCLLATTRPDRGRTRGAGKDGSDPPFFAVSPANRAGGCYRGCYTPCPPLMGSLPSDLSLREGSEHEPQTGAEAPEACPMKMRYPILIIGGLGCSAWFFIYRPFPMPGDDPMLDLVLYHTPNFYTWIVWWYYLAPAAAVIVGGLILISVWRVWFESWGVGMPNIGMLPRWPLSPGQRCRAVDRRRGGSPPGQSRRISQPEMAHHPGARPLYRSGNLRRPWGPAKPRLACARSQSKSCLGRRADPQRRAAGLVLEVKGDFCHDIRRVLAESGRESDYIELGMDGSWQWNPLSG